MKFYKLELINREQSYNQMFGTTPSVGGMMTANVIGGQKSKAGPLQSNTVNSKKIL